MRTIFPAILTPIPSGSGYCARVPDVSGCVTTGGDLAQALDNVADALAGCLCVLEDERCALPAPSRPESLALAPGDTLALVDVDTVEYRRRTDTRAVRKNVSLPAWLASMADRQEVNCSQLLQEAVM